MSGGAAKHRGASCAYCTARMTAKRGEHYRHPTRDHAIPRSRVGAGGPVFIVCRACNQDKGAMTLDEWFARLTDDGDMRAAVVKELVCSIDWEVLAA